MKDSLHVRKNLFQKTSKGVAGVPQFCTRCGKQNNDTAKFCSRCGEKLDSSETTIISTPQILDNRYEIIATVKAGAMGCVFKAKDTRLDNVVAVKQMLSTFANAQDAQYSETRFKEEAKMLSALKHNGLPKVIDYFTEKEPSTGKVMHYLVMEFIDGKDLETIIHERGRTPFSVDEVLNSFRQILDIFEYLNTQKPPIVYLWNTQAGSRLLTRNS
ncbi:MAG: protein kinase [Candidatus Xenobiia bacterium LiM19]